MLVSWETLRDKWIGDMVGLEVCSRNLLTLKMNSLSFSAYISLLIDAYILFNDRYLQGAS